MNKDEDGNSKINLNDQERFECQICHQPFDQYNLEIHFLTHKIDQLNGKNGECHICGKVLVNNSNLKKHIENVHSESNIFECTM